MFDRHFLILLFCTGILLVLVSTIFAIVIFCPSRRGQYLDRLFKVCVALTVFGVGVFFKLLMYPP